MAPDGPPLQLGNKDSPMQVPKDPNTRRLALTITHVEEPNGLPVKVAGPMLPVTVTEALLSTVAPMALLMPVLTDTVTRMPGLEATAGSMLPEEESFHQDLINMPMDTAAGELQRPDTPMLMLLPRVTSNTAPTAVAGRMPAVMATLPLTPLDVVTADGELLPRVPLMPLLARMAGRTATSTVVVPRTNTATLMAMLMLVLMDTVATAPVLAVPVPLVTVPTLAQRAGPSDSLALVELVMLRLADTAMAVNTLELLATLMRDTALTAAELLVVLAPAMLVMVPPVTMETTQALALTAAELPQLVLMAVPTAALTATALTEVTQLVATVETLDTVELMATVETLATAHTATATATATAATLIQVPTDSEATLEMMVIIEIVIVVMVIELSELSKQLLKEDTIPPISGN